MPPGRRNRPNRRGFTLVELLLVLVILALIAGLVGGVIAVAPALMNGLKKQAGAEGGLAGLTKALQTGNHQRYVDNPELMSSEETRLDGNKILGHLLGSKDTSRNVAAQAAESTGIDAGLIKQALPMIAGLAMGALSKGSDAGNASADSIGGMLGGLVGEGFGVDDAANIDVAAVEMGMIEGFGAE